MLTIFITLLIISGLMNLFSPLIPDKIYRVGKIIIFSLCVFMFLI